MKRGEEVAEMKPENRYQVRPRFCSLYCQPEMLDPVRVTLTGICDLSSNIAS